MVLSYIEPVFRPPSEAQSLILQVTNGCSWNHCRFCEMYSAEQKKFRPKGIRELEDELRALQEEGMHPRRIFLADGDAMTLSVRRLTDILKLIRQYFPSVQRVSAYCLPRNLKNKTVEQLAQLRELGLGLVYVGAESGDTQVLSRVNKGETYESSLEAMLKLRAAAIKMSVMVLNGLGGPDYWRQHAQNSARLMNEVQPDYLATLVVSLPWGLKRMNEGFAGGYEIPSQALLFAEMRLFLASLELDSSIFRSDHASNYLILKGVLNQDKARLLAQLDMAIEQPEQVVLRPEWQRGL